MKHVIIAVMMIAMLALVANATPPPAHGSYQAGWGMNPTNWQTATGSFSAWGLYNPNYVGGGDAWVVQWLPSIGYIDYADITLELWVEMYSLQTYHYTSYQWHRLGDASAGNPETIQFIIEGLIQSNNGQCIALTKDTEDLTYLYFREDIFGRTGAPYGYDIPITWEGRWGNGTVYGASPQWGWETIEPDQNGDLWIMDVPKCDHWFQFRGTFELPYHIEDGYYSLNMAGCPTPVL